MSQSTSGELYPKEQGFFAGRIHRVSLGARGVSQKQSFPSSAGAIKPYDDLQMMSTAIMSGDLGQ